jgi:hypoxanthine phosphoribosyltransferase
MASFSLLFSVRFVNRPSNGTGAEKIAAKRKFVGARFGIAADKPFGADHLRLRVRKNQTRQTAVFAAAQGGLFEDLFADFEFHPGHFKLKVGFVQQTGTDFMRPHHVRDVLFTSEQIQRRVHTLIEEIAGGCAADNLVLLGILRGSFIFLADLVRGFAAYDLHPRIDFITLSSYGSGTESSGTVRITHDTDEDLRGADVVIIDDILDSGRTLAFAKELFLKRGARSVKTCVLLDKQANRAVNMEADYAGFPVDDFFVVGYGLDYDNRYRELPHIANLTFLDE